MKFRQLFFLMVLFFSISICESCTNDLSIEPQNFELEKEGEIALIKDKCRYLITSAQAASGESLPSGVSVGVGVDNYVCMPCNRRTCPEELVNQEIRNHLGTIVGWVSGDKSHGGCSACAQGYII